MKFTMKSKVYVVGADHEGTTRIALLPLHRMWGFDSGISTGEVGVWNEEFYTTRAEAMVAAERLAYTTLGASPERANRSRRRRARAHARR